MVEQRLPRPSNDSSIATVGSNQSSWNRGIKLAFPASLFGFTVPLLPDLIVLLLQFVIGDRRIDMYGNFREVARTLVPGAAWCAFVFALAAILDFAPATRIGFVRAVMLVGLASVVGFFATAFATVLFPIGRQSYTSDPWLWLRLVLTLSVPATFTIYLARRRMTTG